LLARPGQPDNAPGLAIAHPHRAHHFVLVDLGGDAVGTGLWHIDQHDRCVAGALQLGLACAVGNVDIDVGQVGALPGGKGEHDVVFGSGLLHGVRFLDANAATHVSEAVFRLGLRHGVGHGACLGVRFGVLVWHLGQGRGGQGGACHQ
jgi:hypothetical protein